MTPSDAEAAGPVDGAASASPASRDRGPSRVAALAAFLGSHRTAFFVVWIVWAVMLGAHYALVLVMAPEVPLGDEWFTLASMVGIENFDFEFLWRRHNEHRIPVPKLIMWACYHVGGFNFRAAPLVYVTTLGVVTAATVVAARIVRGRQSILDAVLPLLLLHWGHAENTLWGFQAQMIGSASISLALLVQIARRRTAMAIPAAAAASFAVCLIALCGQNGVGLVPALSVWIGGSAIVHWRSGSPGSRRTAMVVALLAALPIGVVGLVMYRLPMPQRATIVPDLAVSLEFLMNGLGRATQESQLLAGTFVIVLIASTLALIVVRWWREPAERVRLFGLFCFCGSVTSLALGMGYGRTSAYQLRYTTIAVPLFVAIHFVWAIYARAWRLRIVPVALLAASAACLPQSTFVGRFVVSVWQRSYTGPFLAAVESGKPMPLVIGDHSVVAWHWKHMLDYLLPELKKRSLGMFGRLVEAPEYDRQPIVWADAVATNAKIVGDVVTIGRSSSLTIRLPSPAPVEMLRLAVVVVPHGSNVIRFRMSWRDSQREQFSEARSSEHLFDLDAHGTPLARRAIHDHDFWATVDSWVDEIRIDLDGEPEDLRITSFDALRRK